MSKFTPRSAISLSEAAAALGMSSTTSLRNAVTGRTKTPEARALAAIAFRLPGGEWRLPLSGLAEVFPAIDWSKYGEV